jgi:hypothetical protein
LSSMFHFVGEALSRVCRRGSTGEYWSLKVQLYILIVLWT